MSHSQDDNPITPVTPAQLNRIAGQGIYSSPTALDPAAANVAEALVATLNGSAETPLLTPELQRLTEQVQQQATIGFPRITTDDGVRLSAHTIKLNTSEPRPVVIVPSGWTPFGWVIFEYAYLQLALRGYHVLAYTPAASASRSPSRAAVSSTRPGPPGARSTSPAPWTGPTAPPSSTTPSSTSTRAGSRSSASPTGPASASWWPRTTRRAGWTRSSPSARGATWPTASA